MREAFERWAVVEGLTVNKGSKKEYLNVKTRLAWRAWKAGAQAVMNTRGAMGEWIKCSEQIPPKMTGVIVATEFGHKGDWRMKWATYIPGHPDAGDGGLIPGASWKPSHWMPLPEPPSLV